MLTSVLSGVLLVSGAVLLLVAALAWRRIESPAVDLFAVTATVAGLGVSGLAAGFLAASPLFILAVAVSMALVLPLPWTRFTFSYAGMNDLVSAREIHLASIPLALGLGATALVFGLPAFTDVSITPTGQVGSMAAVGGTILNMSQWFALLYAGGLMLLSSGLLVWTFHRYDHLDSTTGVMLGTVGTIPWLSILFGLQINSISSFALGWSVASGFLIGAGAAVPLVGFSPLFERVPAAGNIGPGTVIEELSDMVIVTDDSGRIVEINAQAQARLDVSETDVIGSRIEELLTSSVTELRERETVALESTTGRRLFAPTVSRVTDRHDNSFGYTVILRDVTEQFTRQQRLNVFNRVLRHNLRNDMTVINGQAEAIRTRTDDDAIADSAEYILRTSEDLAALTEDAYQADHVLHRDGVDGDEARLADVVASVIDTVGVAESGVTCHADVPSDILVGVGEDPLEAALAHLIDNAVKHNDGPDPEIRIEATYDEEEAYPLVVTVSDNGPGIPDNEVPKEATAEVEALSHGTGVGLLVVQWIVLNHGAKISFNDRDPAGTTVDIQFPEARRQER